MPAGTSKWGVVTQEGEANQCPDEHRGSSHEQAHVLELHTPRFTLITMRYCYIPRHGPPVSSGATVPNAESGPVAILGEPSRVLA